MKILEIKELEAGYGKLQILHGINLHVNEKEIVAIIGPNGAGKSTVLKSIMSLVNKSKKNQKASFLSGGQQQMVSIARSLILRPKLLLIDEPSLGLAPKTIHEVFEKIKEIKNKLGITILIVEQNAHKALEICDRCYVLDQGKVALEGTSKLAKDPRVKKLYLGGY